MRVLTKNGISPAAKSFCIASSTVLPRNLLSESASSERNCTPPNRPARSTEECAWARNFYEKL